MIVTVKGVGKLREGEFNGVHYKHRLLYVTYTDNAVCEQGECVERFKVPDRVNDLSSVSVGSEVDVVFNRFGRIVDVREV